MKKLVSVGFWAFVAVSSLLCFMLALVIRLVTFPFDRERRISHLFSCAWASLYAVVYPGWRVRTLNRHRIRRDEAYVLVANHTSIADIVLLFTIFKPFKWVSKHSNFKLPLIGWNMRLSGYIPLVRGDGSSVTRMLSACRDALTAGTSIMMFPEGTRSRDGKVQPFKHGAFTLARDAGVSVVPIAIHGGHLLIPKHGATFAATADLVVEVLEPISSAGFEDSMALAEAARGRILDALEAHSVRAPAMLEPTSLDPA